MVTGTEIRGAGRSRGRGGPGDPVLMSKITVPGLPGWAVQRQRIDQLIANGARGPLTTVTGPPGAGKTMAIALWAAASSSPGTLAWITLDGYDNQPRVFWSYVVAALRQAGITVPAVCPAGARATSVGHDFLLRLAAALATQDPPVVLVLDDVHQLDGTCRPGWARLRAQERGDGPSPRGLLAGGPDPALAPVPAGRGTGRDPGR